MAHLSGKLTRKLVENLGIGRHGDGNGLYLVVDPSGARRWILRVVVKGQRNHEGKPLRTDFGLGGAEVVTLYRARERALEYRRMAKQGLNPRYNVPQSIPTFQELAQQVHLERLPTWKNAKHAQQWINTLRDYAFPKIGRMPVSHIGQPEVLVCLSPIWTSKHETAKRLAQRIKAVLDVAKSMGLREGENPITAIKDARVLPNVSARPKHHAAMPWNEIPAFFSELEQNTSVASKALQFCILSACRTSEVLGARWEEFDFEQELWTIPPERMKTGQTHRVPLTPEMVKIVESLKPLQSKYVFEGQKRHHPLSNMALLMLLRRLGCTGVTVHGFRSAFRDWAAEATNTTREVAERCLAHKLGSDVEQAYARSDLLEKRRILMKKWTDFMEVIYGGNKYY